MMWNVPPSSAALNRYRRSACVLFRLAFVFPDRSDSDDRSYGLRGRQLGEDLDRRCGPAESDGSKAKRQ